MARELSARVVIARRNRWLHAQRNTTPCCLPDGSGDHVTSGPHRTDEHGVAVTAIAIDYDGGRFDRWFHALVPGNLVGALRSLRMDDGPPPPAPEIRMQPSRELRGRVRVPAMLRSVRSCSN